MRLLLFLISAIFSFVFYSFHLLMQGKEVFGKAITKPEIIISPISGNFLIETIVFLVLGGIFIVIFTPLGNNKKSIDKKSLYYLLFYIILLLPIYFGIFEINKLIIITLLVFIFSDVSFNFISNIENFKEQRLKLRYLGLGLNYFSILLSIIYFYFSGFSYYLFLSCIYSIVFNYNIHKKFGNYVSLSLSIILTGILLFQIFIVIKRFYIYFINY